MKQKALCWLCAALAALCGGLCFLWGNAISEKKLAQASAEALKAEIRLAELESGQYVEAMAQVQTDAETLQEAIEDKEALERKNGELTAELAQAHQTLSSNETASAALALELSTQRTKLEETEDTLSGYIEQYDQLQQYAVSLETILQGYAEDPGAEERLKVIADLQERLAQSETEAAALRREKESWEAQLTEAEENYAGASALLKESGGKSAEAEQELETMRAEYQQMQEELTQVQTELAGTAALLEESRKEAEKDQAALRLAQSRCAVLSEQAEEKDASISAYESQTASLRAEIASLQEQLTESQLFAAGRDALLTETSDRLAAAEAEIVRLTQEAEKAEESIPEAFPRPTGRQEPLEQ